MLKTLLLRSIFIFILILFHLSAFRCNASKKSVNDNSGFNHPYFPVKSGSIWKYINETDSTETIAVEIKQSDSDNKKSIIDKFVYFGNPQTEMEVFIDSSGNIMLKEPGGNVHTMMPSADTFSNGLSWKYSSSLTAYLTTTSSGVKTPAGYYDCIFINYTDGFAFSYEMWLSKGTGIVKWGANRTNPPTLRPVYYVLKEYQK